MEIGKQRQVCQGFFCLNQGSNPQDLLLDDPWDLTLVSRAALRSGSSFGDRKEMFSIRNQKNERKKVKLDLISETKREDSAAAPSPRPLMAAAAPCTERERGESRTARRREAVGGADAE